MEEYIVFTATVPLGPPWGFRVVGDPQGTVIISQVLSDGHAFNAGLRIGDAILAIGSKESPTLEDVHNALRSAQGSLCIVLRHAKPCAHNESHSAAQATPVVPALTTQNQPVKVIINGSNRNATTPTPIAGKPPVHHVFASASNGLSVPSYNGGFRGSTQDKRKFFELVAQKQVPDEPPPRRQHVPKIKCRTSDRFLDLVAMDRSVASDAGTEISGYDSVAPDFATGRDSRQLASGNLTPVSSIDPCDDQWIDARRCYTSESEASFSLVKENFNATRPEESINSVFDVAKTDVILDQQKQAVEVDNAIASVTQDITTLLNLHAMQGTKDPALSDGNAQYDMYDPSSRSSIEIPQYQGVAELRHHLAGKLDMKTPTGARPQAPPIVHKGAHHHRSCITPMPAPTYSTTTVPNPSRRLSVSFIDPSTTGVKEPIPAELNGVDTYRLQYDSDDLSAHGTEYSGLTPNSANKEFAWQRFSGGHQEVTPTRCSIDTGYSSEVSPKDKQAEGFNAHQGLLIRADYINVKNDDGTMEAREPTEETQQHVVYSETGAPFSATSVPGVDGRVYMLGDLTPTPPANVEEAIKNVAPEGSTQNGANTLACEAYADDGRNDDPGLAETKADSLDIEPREKPLELAAWKSDLSPSSETSASHLHIRSSPDLSAADCTGPRAELPDALAHSPPRAALHCDGVTAAFSANINSSSVHSKHDEDRRSFAQRARGLENCSGASIRTEQSRPVADIVDRRADQHASWHQQQEVSDANGCDAAMYPRRGSSGFPATGSDGAQQSLWYRNMYRKLHGRPNEGPRSQTPNMSFRDDRENAYQAKSETLPRRSKSTPRYDPVADMELVDRFAIAQRQTQQARSNMDLRAQSGSSAFVNTSAPTSCLNAVTRLCVSRSNRDSAVVSPSSDGPPSIESDQYKPINVHVSSAKDRHAGSAGLLKMLQLPSTPTPTTSGYSTSPNANIDFTTARSESLKRSSTLNSFYAPAGCSADATNKFAYESRKSRHFHLPPHRLSEATRQRRPMQCLRRSHEFTSQEIDALYETLGGFKGVERHFREESLADILKLRHIELTLERTVLELDLLVEHLNTFGRVRSKSAPDFALPCDVVNPRLSSNASSQARDNIEVLYNGSHNLPSGSNSLGRLSKDAIIHHQRAEKLSEELVDQQNRRHGYVPNSTVSLQNNLNRLEHLLTDFGRPSSRSSTPLRSGSSGAPQVHTCTALYRFVGSSPRELSLNRGDVLRIRREVDPPVGNWLEGERHGQVGIFPSSYVQVDDDPSTSHNRVRAIYPFQARNANEMSLKQGDTVRLLRSIDANWVEGINTKSGQIGILPKSYVRHADEVNGGVQSDLVPDRPKTPKTVGSLLSRGASPSVLKRSDHSQEVQAWEQRRLAYGSSGPAHIPRNAEIYRAIFSYKPEHPDELDLVENDIVFVVEKCDDGWYIGTLLRTGQYGTFPGNFVVKH